MDFSPKSSQKPSLQREAIQAWRRKRQAIYPCVFVGIALLCAGLLLKDTWAGKPLTVVAAVLAFVAKSLNTSCQTCPHCGYTSVPAQNIRRGFTCERCGFSIPDLR